MSRYVSPFGSLGERTGQGAGAPGPEGPGRHVWVHVGHGWRPGVLERWERQGDAAWWGLVGFVGPDGLVAELVRQDRLKPVFPVETPR